MFICIPIYVARMLPWHILMGGDRWCVLCLEVSEEPKLSRRSPTSVAGEPGPTTRATAVSAAAAVWRARLRLARRAGVSNGRGRGAGEAKRGDRRHRRHDGGNASDDGAAAGRIGGGEPNATRRNAEELTGGGGAGDRLATAWSRRDERRGGALSTTVGCAISTKSRRRDESVLARTYGGDIEDVYGFAIAELACSGAYTSTLEVPRACLAGRSLELARFEIGGV
ncbi:hypothetical protein Scep_019532 [Stephania cephalantha]|uniref:Uncharacterized protein n=1 Tax=Stephania cephalantha TaxID=152367 RepID=A0AAP0NM83_9MAGN